MTKPADDEASLLMPPDMEASLTEWPLRCADHHCADVSRSLFLLLSESRRHFCCGWA